MEKEQILDALADMWNQYCAPPYFHDFMAAGEYTERVLEEHGLLREDRTAINIGDSDYPIK